MIKVIHSIPIWLLQTETWLYNQVKFLPHGVESHIVCERTENLGQFALPNIHSLERSSTCRYFWDKGLRMLGVRRHLGFMAKTARETEADILHSHFGNIGWADMGAAREAGLRHVVTFYGQDVNRIPRAARGWHKRYRELFGHADKIICEGPFMAKAVAGLGCPEEKILVHHLGVAVDEIGFRPRKWDRSGPLRVLISGNFQEKKGIPYALEALAGLRMEPRIEITIIGDANLETRSIAEKERIRATIRGHDLSSRVRMLGYQPHSVFFQEAYNHHIFLSPSVTAGDGDTEGGAPISILEMIATGMPVFATRHCDIPGLFPGNGRDFLAEERDADGLLSLILRFLDKKDPWEPMLTAGRAHVEKEFNCVTQGLNLKKIYTGVLEGG